MPSPEPIHMARPIGDVVKVERARPACSASGARDALVGTAQIVQDDQHLLDRLLRPIGAGI